MHSFRERAVINACNKQFRTRDILYLTRHVMFSTPGECGFVLSSGRLTKN